MKSLCQYISKYMGALVLAAALLALAFPQALGQVPVAVINYMLGVVMFGMGLTLNLRDFRIVFSRPKDVFIGCLAQFTVMPLLAWGLSRLFSLDEALMLGVVLVGCCPGGTASNVITYLAKGDVALSVGMTGVSTLLAPLLTPLLTWALAGKSIDVDVASMFLNILWVVILPIIIGLLVKWLWPRFTERAADYLPAFSSVAIAFIVAIVIAASAAKLLAGGLTIVAVVMLHNVSGLCLGYLIGRLLRLSEPKKRAIAIEVGMQNSGLASGLAASHFAAYPLATIPGAIFSVWHNISGTLVARLFTWTGAAKRPEATKRTAVLLLCCLSASAAKAVDYSVNPQHVAQRWDGWGVSLCWWAGQCGRWEDGKIDELIDWLVSPDGLNYTHFRYNIGGGDDPENRNCEPHHMGKGKGLRAEMEGFKDFSADQYHWERDAAQRKILLRIKEKRPDAVFEAFSNSPPYYMTYSGCVGGNANPGKDNLRPEYYEEFAHYLVDVCKHYKDAYGILFKTLEPFNESATSYWNQGGSQEGCHFDYASQVAFLRVLSPILRQSGLSTIISASDETSVGHSIEAFRAYQKAGVLPLVGQWNTHTYQGDNRQRRQLARMVLDAGMPFWMSETGSGGKGIEGNLNMVQRLFDDVRNLQPEAWLDWQYMEEHSDQWCTINGSFKGQTCRKVKNYYVRQQCSRFIRRGHHILRTECPQSLASVNASRDTLTLVLLAKETESEHNIRLDGMTVSRPDDIRICRTSRDENMQSIAPSGTTLVLTGNNKENSSPLLSVRLPAWSVTTLVIPFRQMAD